MTHEILKGCKGAQEEGVMFKIDFEKAYDSIEWDFLLKVLKLKGFPDIWITWVHNLLRGGSSCIEVNGFYGVLFQKQKGFKAR